jgi:hypothetical protein
LAHFPACPKANTPLASGESVCSSVICLLYKYFGPGFQMIAEYSDHGWPSLEVWCLPSDKNQRICTVKVLMVLVYVMMAALSLSSK